MLDYLATMYRDPLFGITILVGIIVILVFADYGRNRYRAKKRQIALENFTKSYDGSALSDELVEFLHLAKNPTPPLLLLAKTYAKAGDSAMAIKIYLSLLDTTRNPQEKIIILESLGITYFDAGFLQRAKNIFLEILKTHPRNTQILSYLMRAHENMGEYRAALDTLECLDELNAQEERELRQMKQYLHFMILSQDSLLPLDKKHREIISLMRSSGQINRLVLEYLFIYDRERFWEELARFHTITFCLDILWRCDKAEVPFERLKSRPDILQVFIAKGFYTPVDSRQTKTQSLESTFSHNATQTHKVDSKEKMDCHENPCGFSRNDKENSSCAKVDSSNEAFSSSLRADLSAWQSTSNNAQKIQKVDSRDNAKSIKNLESTFDTNAQNVEKSQSKQAEVVLDKNAEILHEPQNKKTENVLDSNSQAAGKVDSRISTHNAQIPNNPAKDSRICIEIFELEVLRVLAEHSTQRGELSFEYRCHHCKNLFPFDSYRCPICAKMGEMDLVYKIIKHHTQRQNL
ncbi:hypothetical protein NYG90_05820 [Helicobacter sp. XJK30-2]|uniref:Uncharacterized protein n=1 Tax=Helicobacter zhangjianzhongii TaxID=2974574 RepID=A0ACC6FTD0_9HELI|nr:hypothetical protein [Helicobacter sp. XJK30-2]MDL0082193.1 hypothetical protein [Helicobacter sp. XJK30-2]